MAGKNLESMAMRGMAIFCLGVGLGIGPANAQPASALLEARWIDGDRSFAAEGSVESVRQALVAAQVPGRIVAVKVDAGQRVSAGQVLMQIDTREAAEGLAAAQARLREAQSQVERTRNLHAKQFVSQSALDRAEADFQAARAQAGQAGAGAAHGTVTSPIAGVVGLRHVELGEMAQPGRALATVFDPRHLRVIASVPQAQLAEVRRASRVRVELPTGRWLDGARFEVLPMVDPQTRSATARVYLPDNAATEADLAPGLFARVHFVTGRAQRLTVPAAAVVRRGEVTGLYVADEKGALRLRQVRLGQPLADGSLEVLSGLKVGERFAPDGVAATLTRPAARP